MEKPEGKKGQKEDPGVDEKIILRWVFVKWNEAWTGMIWITIGTVGGFFKLRRNT